MRVVARARFLAVVLAALAAVPAAPQITPLPVDEGAPGLGLALRRLPVSGSVLYVTAHPDDENNGVLVALSRGRGLRTGLLTLTRGDGGQNEIGPELFQAIGILRTEELMAIHRYDAAEQFFTRAYEFGYSFSVEETFQKWGREEILADVVRVVRSFRPDVILTLALEAPGGGQHHQAAAQLAKEAFRAAADASRFPEQLEEGLRPWQARKIYQGGTGGGALEGGASPAAVTLKTSEFDPLLGMSSHQFGMLARALHKCQGAGQLQASPGDGRAVYALVDSEPKFPDKESDILQGVDTSLAGLARFAKGQEAEAAFLGEALKTLEGAALQAQASYDPKALHKSVAPLASGLKAVRALQERIRGSRLSEDTRAELLQRLRVEEADWSRALGIAQGIVFRVTVDDGDAVRGQTLNVLARVHNQSQEPVRIDAVRLRVPEGWTAQKTAGDLATLVANEKVEWKYALKVGPEARYSQPYWKRNPEVDRYEIEIPEHHTLPWSPPDVVGRLEYTSAGVPATLELPAYWRYEGRWVGGEKQKVLNVVPALSVRLTPEIAVIPAGAKAQREFRVRVLNNAKGAAKALASLEVPSGWSVTPAQAVLELRYEGEEVAARFFVTPAAGARAGDYSVSAVVNRDGEIFHDGYQTIAYDHIQERHLFHPAQAALKVLDVKVAPSTLVGYVAGAGDEVAGAIQQLGARLEHLSPDDVAFGDLSKYTTIVTGIRAYQTRPDLRAHNARLLKFAEDGGHLVVQYNKFEFNQLSQQPAAEGFSGGGRPREQPNSPFAPFPAAVSSNRISVEDAPVQFLIADHPLVMTPNRISDADFAGWVQERGLYFLSARDPRYIELLTATDPWPKNPGEKKGMLATAIVGKGTWTYVGLGLFRQLPAGTPGAYRLLANLISQPRGR
jgi:LmbE family N-acetylglucosaminyl deacetylase